jgi:glycosyltransferase involved in cell wall biosynthesis
MKIVMLNWKDPSHPEAGGSEVVADQLLLGLSARGHDVALICGGPIRPRSYPVYQAGSTFSQYLVAPFVAWRHCWDADVVIDVENGLPFFTPIWWRIPRVLLIHHIHTEQWSDRFPRPLASIFRWIESRLMPRIYSKSTWVAISESTKSSIRALEVGEPEVNVIENGVGQVESTPSNGQEKQFFSYIGRLVPHKRVQLVIDAWSKISQKIDGYLVIAGDGALSSEIEQLAQSTNRVLFRGAISEAEKWELLEKSSLFITGTRHEGWGVTVMEAASAGTPTLAFKVPGIQDSVVHDVTGFLIEESEDPAEQLARAWLSLIRNPSEIERLGNEAQDRAAQFSWTNTIVRWEKLLIETAKKTND